MKTSLPKPATPAPPPPLPASFSPPLTTAIIRALRQILGLPNVQAEMPDQLKKAIDYYEKGLDFADALHLASSPEGVSFYTFDTAFIKRARSLKVSVKAL